MPPESQHCRTLRNSSFRERRWEYRHGLWQERDQVRGVAWTGAWRIGPGGGPIEHILSKVLAVTADVRERIQIADDRLHAIKTIPIARRRKPFTNIDRRVSGPQRSWSGWQQLIPDWRVSGDERGLSLITSVNVLLGCCSPPQHRPLRFAIAVRVVSKQPISGQMCCWVEHHRLRRQSRRARHGYRHNDGRPNR